MSEPLRLFRRWLRRAERDSRIKTHDACSLSTAGKNGKPDARIVLLKEADERGFVFYTNLRSTKARQIKENPRATLTFFWDVHDRQVRASGKIQTVTDAEADAYFATRPRKSQLGAWASNQSAPLSSRAALLRAFAREALRHRGKPIPRPPFWSGFRLVPSEIEFWSRGAFRLHTRELFVRRGAAWKRSLLYP